MCWPHAIPKVAGLSFTSACERQDEAGSRLVEPGPQRAVVPGVIIIIFGSYNNYEYMQTGAEFIGQHGMYW